MKNRKIKRARRKPVSTAVKQATAVDPFDPASYTKPGIIAAGGPPDDQAEVEQLGGVVKLVASDIGHVLVDFDWSEVSRGFCERVKLPMAEFRKVLAHVGTLGYESGDIDTAGVVKAVNDLLGSDVTVDEFHRLWNHGFHENEEVAAILDRLAASYRLYALSNTNESHWSFLQDTLKIDRHFHELILSYLVRARKPDQRIYLELLNHAGVEARECLFIDDLEPNIQTARELGMHAIHFVGVEDLKERLAKMGLLS